LCLRRRKGKKRRRYVIQKHLAFLVVFVSFLNSFLFIGEEGKEKEEG